VAWWPRVGASVVDARGVLRWRAPRIYCGAGRRVTIGPGDRSGARSGGATQKSSDDIGPCGARARADADRADRCHYRRAGGDWRGLRVAWPAARGARARRAPRREHPDPPRARSPSLRQRCAPTFCRRGSIVEDNACLPVDSLVRAARTPAVQLDSALEHRSSQ
jgi:hypothetical protein